MSTWTTLTSSHSPRSKLKTCSSSMIRCKLNKTNLRSLWRTLKVKKWSLRSNFSNSRMIFKVVRSKLRIKMKTKSWEMKMEILLNLLKNKKFNFNNTSWCNNNNKSNKRSIKNSWTSNKCYNSRACNLKRKEEEVPKRRQSQQNKSYNNKKSIFCNFNSNMAKTLIQTSYNNLLWLNSNSNKTKLREESLHPSPRKRPLKQFQVSNYTTNQKLLSPFNLWLLEWTNTSNHLLQTEAKWVRRKRREVPQRRRPNNKWPFNSSNSYFSNNSSSYNNSSCNNSNFRTSRVMAMKMMMWIKKSLKLTYYYSNNSNNRRLTFRETVNKSMKWLKCLFWVKKSSIN